MPITVSRYRTTSWWSDRPVQVGEHLAGHRVQGGGDSGAHGGTVGTVSTVGTVGKVGTGGVGVVLADREGVRLPLLDDEDPGGVGPGTDGLRAEGDPGRTSSDDQEIQGLAEQEETHRSRE